MGDILEEAIPETWARNDTIVSRKTRIPGTNYCARTAHLIAHDSTLAEGGGGVVCKNSRALGRTFSVFPNFQKQY